MLHFMLNILQFVYMHFIKFVWDVGSDVNKSFVGKYLWWIGYEGCGSEGTGETGAKYTNYYS